MYRLAALVLLLLAGGCQAVRPLYYRGQYEVTIYQSYSKPGKVSVEEQIQKLQEDVAKAAGSGAAVLPGLHAHIGYLYASGGQIDAARREFEAEKALFPESSVFMDRMIKKLAPAPATP